MRATTFLAICLAALAARASDAGTSHINLNKPGALERLAQDNPSHFAKVQRILDEVQRHPVDAIPQWMKAEFDADRVIAPPILKTSYPAKRAIHFRLDNTAYTATLIQEKTERLVPVR